MAVNYIKNIAGGVFGMEIIEEVVIEGHNASPDKAQEIIANGLEEVKKSSSIFTICPCITNIFFNKKFSLI